MCGFSLVVASRGYSSLWCAGFSLWWLLLLQSSGSRSAGFSSCGSQALERRHTGLVAPWHVESSQTRDRTCVPCIGRRILNHCTIREVHSIVHYSPYVVQQISRTYSSSITKTLYPLNNNSLFLFQDRA